MEVLVKKGNSNKSNPASKESALRLQKLAEEKRKRKIDADEDKRKRLKYLSPNRGTDVDDWENSRDAHKGSGSAQPSTERRTGGPNLDIIDLH